MTNEENLPGGTSHSGSHDDALQSSLDAGNAPDRSDSGSMVYWRVMDGIRDVRPVLSDDFAARVATRVNLAASIGRLRPSIWSALVPIMTSSAALVVGAGTVYLFEGFGYLESSPLGALGFVTDLPMALLATSAALAALFVVDALIEDRDELAKGKHSL